MTKIAKNKAVTAYKVFDSDWRCRSFQFEVGKSYKHEGRVKICSSGFHACLQLAHCFSYYKFDPKNKVAEVKIWGKTDSHEEDSKICGSEIEIIRELNWQEVLVAANAGANNTGFGNSGYRNSGHWNSGHWNSGHWNSGNQNSGYRNSGYRNSGHWNSGHWNIGHWNSGHWNSGNHNSGDWNSGNHNSGYHNSGYQNSGDWNSGDRNSGDQNSGYRNSGAFCTDDNPEMLIFDKPSGIKVRDWENSKAVRLMWDRLNTSIWICGFEMNAKEKEDHPHWETTDGYLKTISLKEAWSNMWGHLDDESKRVFLDLPNFDPAKFEEITGINVAEAAGA